MSIDAALAWATLPAGSAAWWSSRLQIARGFAAYMHAIDSDNEVPPFDLLPSPPHRATPYLYSPEQIDALIAAAGTLRTPLRVATMLVIVAWLGATLYIQRDFLASSYTTPTPDPANRPMR